LLKKVDKFQWTTEAQEALEALKKFLTTPPVLKPPRRATAGQPAEGLLLYISCTTHVVSTMLVVERAEEEHAYPVQHQVYFINEVLGPSKIRYPQVQKLLYVVLLTARKLRHYFDDHKVIVVTGFPIGDILHNKEAIGRIAKWACELEAHDIEFRPRTMIKTQALIDFISDWTEHQVPDSPEVAEVWRMYFDGSLKLQGAGVGILFIAPGGEQVKYALQLLFPASNNAAEYEALVHGLSIALSLDIKNLMVYGNSLVVISQINKDWDYSTDSMGKYCAAMRNWKTSSKDWSSITWKEIAMQQQLYCRSWDPVGPRLHLGSSSKKYHSQSSSRNRWKNATPLVSQRQIPMAGVS
jgi:ribonuclease HI